MRKLRVGWAIAGLGLIASAGAAGAGPFDGTYLERAAIDRGHVSCANAGQWDWTIVDGNRLAAGEGGCLLRNPVQVREMQALLYDADCAVEGTEFRTRLMLMRRGDGIAIVGDRWFSDLVYCHPAFESDRH